MLQAINIRKDFKEERVINDLNFTLQEHEMLSILGRSGSGKTTLLKILAGLENMDQGQVLLNGKDISLLKPNLRDIAYLYQEPLLFPHLNVYENIAFGLRLRKVSGSVIDTKVREMLEQLELPEQGKKMPGQLSGGQRQRVAFGRALIIQPKVLLLDEPFGALDAETRTNMQQFLKRMSGEMGLTGLFITHDLKEAILMGKRIGMMVNGQLKIYQDQQEFIEDERTGVQEELAFWKGL
jgi:putrescine transport system ATP-binding protein